MYALINVICYLLLHFVYENKFVKISLICIICCFLIYSKDYIDLKCQLVFSGNLVYVGNKYTVSSTSISHILPPSKIQTAILPLHSIWTIICSENHSCLMIWNLELKDQDKFYPLVPTHVYLSDIKVFFSLPKNLICNIRILKKKYSMKGAKSVFIKTFILSI